MKTFNTREKVAGMRSCRKTALAMAIKIEGPFEVETLEGTMTGKPGDYLMCGVSGELYPCDADIFESSYEWVSDNTDE